MPAQIDKKIRVLLFPAGSEIAFEIYHSLRHNLHVEIFGASGKSDHASYLYDSEHYFEGPYQISDEKFNDHFTELLKEQKIDMVMPTHDSVTEFLAKHRDKYPAKILTSPYESTRIARQKILTYELFQAYDFLPKQYLPPYQNLEYPIFLKPNQGQGGKGTCLVHTYEELQEQTSKQPDLVAYEYLPGEELSVDCFTDRHGQLRFIGPRTRARIDFGISFRTESRPVTQDIQTIAETINTKVAIRGAWFFQVKKDSTGKYKLMEFAVRQASTMGLYRQIGVNFALLTIFDALDIDVKILKNDYPITLDRRMLNRYKADFTYTKVYIDFDDTIIINEKINIIALQFLYQCKYAHKKICLLTKHEFDLDETLQKYCLAKNLFDEIVILHPGEDKTDHIVADDAIFIDNYFFDREKVKQRHNIPVFDVDAIESLLLNT
ncbi:MAG: ATP-grasp domain-containing protein [Candidatus Nomurabacteria bacterium]|nr:MAG: ATP-grasp domain-containing protein [Candidatus Nomurabacteria bacterium]